MDNTDARRQYDEARRLFGQGRYVESLAFMERLSREYPHKASILEAHAQCLARLGRIYEAVLLCNRLAHDLDEKRGVALRNQILTQERASGAPAMDDLAMARDVADDLGIAAGGGAGRLRALVLAGVVSCALALLLFALVLYTF